MLTQDDLLLWYRKLGLLESTQALIASIRTSEPVRRVAGGPANVVGRYPSKKMGRMIQFESHRVELAFMLEFEHDASVLEFYDQPCSLTLLYTGRSGRRVTARHTPDYFVLRADSAGWEECKTEQQLMKLAEQSPHRYQRDGGGWRCPPGEAHAAMLGLYYRIRSSETICWTLQRNIQYLADYLRSDLVQKDPANREALMAHVRRIPGISLEDLLASATAAEARECLFSMIALGDLYVDLRESSLWEPERVHVFPDHCSAQRGITGISLGSGLNLIDLRSGDHIRWDTKEWTVANVGATMVSLIAPDRSFTEIPVAVLEEMIKERRVQVSQHSMHHEVGGIRSEIAAANEADLEIANRRSCAVRSYLLGDHPPGIPPRTVRLWAARFRKAEQTLGDGYLGLIPRTQNRGNRRARIAERPRALMAQFIANDYETHKQKSKYASWIALKLACERDSVVAPSYRAFLRALKLRSRYTLTLRRKGRRAAYPYEPRFWDLEMKTPRHGDRPFEVGHIDHTELDVEMRCSATGRSLGRPWLTLLMDAFSRRVLAKCLIFDVPTYRSCMLLLRDCVRRHGRLPQFLVLDGGREFDSTYFETLNRALVVALAHGHKRIEMNDLERCALEVSRCERIASECWEGEMRIDTSPERADQLRTRLGLGKNRGAPSDGPPAPESRQPSKARRQRRPGTRSPRRDLIGTACHG